MAKPTFPKSVTIFEVGPRDGLQNETSPISVEDKVELVNRLSRSGLTKIEAGSFVSPKWVPQMANSDRVFQNINRAKGVCYSALTPNMQGLHAALDAEVDEIAVFAAASEGFSQKNINCSIEESLARFEPVIKAAHAKKIRVRGYVSCVIACPYDGEISPSEVTKVSKQLLDLGCYQISLGDTIGVGTPNKINSMIESLKREVDVSKLAIHCHDTYGQAIANIVAALESGVNTIDSSVAGLGGCPYAKGASGNVATEDVLYLLEGLGIDSRVNLDVIVETGNFISQRLQRTNQSKVAQARAN